jgi:hypothetical protein
MERVQVLDGVGLAREQDGEKEAREAGRQPFPLRRLLAKPVIRFAVF